MSISKPLQGKVALVTGGAIRIGKSICEQLAEAGCSVMIHYHSSEDAAKSLLADLRVQGYHCEMVRADLAVSSDAESIVPATLTAFGQLDFVINNAAIFLDGDLAATSLQDWRQQFDINLTAAFVISKAFAALPSENADRCIVNILDARVFRPAADHFAYRLTKSALLAMTQGLAADLAPTIRVNGVALGAIAPPPGAGQPYLDDLAATRIPLRRAGAPAMVAENVLHLLTQPFLTGEVIRLDGGEFL